MLTFAGCVLVTGLFPLGQQRVSPSTILLGLGAGFGYALYSILGKFALAKYSPSTVTFYTFLFAAVFSLPLSGLHRHLALLLDWRAAIGGLGIGAVCCILPYLLYTSGLKYVEAGRAAHSGDGRALCGRPAGHSGLPRDGHPLQAAGHGGHLLRHRAAQPHGPGRGGIKIFLRLNFFLTGDPACPYNSSKLILQNR